MAEGPATCVAGPSACVGLGVNNSFDGANDAVNVVRSVVGLDGNAQEGAIVPDHHRYLDEIVIPQAGVLVLLTVGHWAECHLVPPGVAFVADGLYAGNSGDLLACF